MPSKINIQTNVLRYMFQYNQSRQYLPYVDPSVFDLVEHKITYELLKMYMDKYTITPDPKNFLHFCDQQEGMEEETYDAIRKVVRVIKKPLEDIQIVKEELLMYAKKKMFTSLTTDHILPLLDDFDYKGMDRIYDKLNNIRSIDLEKKTNGISLFDPLIKKQSAPKVYPSCIKGLNAFTAKGGFYPPQNILFAKPPKSFGTGLMIHLAIGYLKHGLDVCIADWENGEEVIYDRFRQGIIHATAEEIFTDKGKEKLERMMSLYRRFAGGKTAFIYGMRPSVDSIANFDIAMEEFISKNPNFDPTVCVFDYLDIAGCSDKKISDRRLKIQKNYYDAVSLNIKYNMFSFTASKIKQSAIGSDNYRVTDLAEDFEKGYNAHACFAWVTDEEKMKENYVSMHPMVQREGISYSTQSISMELDADRMTMNEVILED